MESSKLHHQCFVMRYSHNLQCSIDLSAGNFQKQKEEMTHRYMCCYVLPFLVPSKAHKCNPPPQVADVLYFQVIEKLRGIPQVELNHLQLASCCFKSFK